MGKGKGNVDHWVAVVRPGRVMFEVGGVQKNAQNALQTCRSKIRIKTRLLNDWREYKYVKN